MKSSSAWEFSMVGIHPGPISGKTNVEKKPHLLPILWFKGYKIQGFYGVMFVKYLLYTIISIFNSYECDVTEFLLIYYNTENDIWSAGALIHICGNNLTWALCQPIRNPNYRLIQQFMIHTCWWFVRQCIYGNA